MAPADRPFNGMRRVVGVSVVTQLVALAFDGWAHATGVADEQLWTVSNPGHALFAAATLVLLLTAFAPVFVFTIPAGPFARVDAIALASIVALTALLVVTGTVIDRPIVLPGVETAAHVHSAGGPGEHHGTAGADAGSDGGVELQRQLDEAAAAVARIGTLAEAKRLGYRRFTDFHPGEGYHYAKWGFVDGTFSIDRPEMLLFASEDGEEPVAALSYFVFADEPPLGFAGGDDLWPGHQRVCLAPGGSVVDGDETPKARCDALGGTIIGGEDTWMLHVWPKTAMDNPAGVFGMENPRIR